MFNRLRLFPLFKAASWRDVYHSSRVPISMLTVGFDRLK
jgi:hypothetical protein